LQGFIGDIMKRTPLIIIIFNLILLLTAACSTHGSHIVPTDTYTVSLYPADFVKVVDNPYYPLVPGIKFVYEGQTSDGLERIEIEVLRETREVVGIGATVLHDTVYLNSELIEDTYDWFAQDKAGNVWYLGEDVSNYENGVLVDRRLLGNRR
jgi:hypothetical protein